MACCTSKAWITSPTPAVWRAPSEHGAKSWASPTGSLNGPRDVRRSLHYGRAHSASGPRSALRGYPDSLSGGDAPTCARKPGTAVFQGGIRAAPEPAVGRRRHFILALEALLPCDVRCSDPRESGGRRTVTGS